MSEIFETLDLEQMFSDIEDYLIIVEGELDVIDKSNPDYNQLNVIQDRIVDILDRIERIWYNHGN